MFSLVTHCRASLPSNLRARVSAISLFFLLTDYTNQNVKRMSKKILPKSWSSGASLSPARQNFVNQILVKINTPNRGQPEGRPSLTTPNKAVAVDFAVIVFDAILTMLLSQ